MKEKGQSLQDDDLLQAEASKSRCVGIYALIYRKATRRGNIILGAVKKKQRGNVIIAMRAVQCEIQSPRS